MRRTGPILLSPAARLSLLSLAVVAVLFSASVVIARQRALFSTLEGETALYAREMLRSGDWMVIRRNGVEFNQKPPFFYWAVAGFSRIAGSVDELTCRLPSIAGALLVLALFRALAPGKDGRHLSILAAAVFIASPKVFWMTQVARIDMLFTALCFAAVVSYARYFEGRPLEGAARPPGARSSAGYFLFFASSALATLLKGPIGAILPFLAAALFLLLRREIRELRRLFLGPGALVYLGITVPLYGLVVLRTEGRFYREFFLIENLARFFGSLDLSLGDTFYRQPWWYCSLYFLAGFFPWTLFFLAFLWRRVKDRRLRSPRDSLLLTYFFTVLFFFSVAGVKRSDYLLPLYPAAAFLTAEFMLGEGASLRWRWLFAVLAASVGAALLAFTWGRFLGPGSALIERPAIARLIPPEKVDEARFIAARLLAAYPWVALTSLAVLLLSAFALMAKEKLTAARGILAVTLASYIFGIAAVVPFADEAQDPRPFCQAVKRELGGRELYFYRTWMEDVAYYLDRVIPRKEKDDMAASLRGEGPPACFIIEEEDHRKLLGEGMRFPRVIAEGSPGLRPLRLVSGDRRGD